MTVQLSSAEEEAASSRIQSAIKARFPEAGNAAGLYAQWPEPKPAVPTLWMLLNDPVPLLLDSKNKELFLSLPKILSTSDTGIPSSDIYGEKLGKHYDDLRRTGHTTRPSSSPTLPTPARVTKEPQAVEQEHFVLSESDPVDPNTSAFIRRYFGKIMEQFFERFASRVAEIVVGRMKDQGLVVAAPAKPVEGRHRENVPDAPPPPQSQHRSDGQVFADAPAKSPADEKPSRKKEGTRRTRWSSILLADSSFLKNTAPALLNALAAKGIKTKRDLTAAYMARAKTKKFSAGIIADSLLAGYVVDRLRSREKITIKESMNIVAAIAGLSGQEAYAKAIESEIQKRSTGHVDEIHPKTARHLQTAVSDKENPMVEKFVELGLELSDARTLVDLGVRSYEKVVSSLNNQEIVKVLGLITAPDKIRQAAKAASELTARAPEAVQQQKKPSEPEAKSGPVHPAEKVLKAEDSLKEWRQSGLNSTQLDLLNDDGVKTIYDIAGLSFEELSEALGDDALDPAFGTDVILRAKIICREIGENEYPQLRGRWIENINHQRLG